MDTIGSVVLESKFTSKQWSCLISFIRPFFILMSLGGSCGRDKEMEKKREKEK